MEASSHGLVQNRLDGIRMSVGIFTNLTRDHFDYHKNFNSYFEAKSILFKELVPQNGGAVISTDGLKVNQCLKSLNQEFQKF